jgi:hypothetical protein
MSDRQYRFTVTVTFSADGADVIVDESSGDGLTPGEIALAHVATGDSLQKTAKALLEEMQKAQPEQVPLYVRGVLEARSSFRREEVDSSSRLEFLPPCKCAEAGRDWCPKHGREGKGR